MSGKQPGIIERWLDRRAELIATNLMQDRKRGVVVMVAAAFVLLIVVPATESFIGRFYLPGFRFWSGARFLMNTTGFFLMLLLFGGSSLFNYRRALLSRTTTLQEVRQLNSRQFEEFIAGLLALNGFRIDLGPAEGPDGGVDITAKKGGITTLVQCKVRHVDSVGVEVIRQLLGVLDARKADRGIVVTSGSFTAPAVAEFDGNPKISLWDGPMLVDQLVRHSEDVDFDNKLDDAALVVVQKIRDRMKVAESSDVIAIPNCELCGERMVLKSSKKNERFWACPNWKFGNQGCRSKGASIPAELIPILDPARGRSGQ